MNQGGGAEPANGADPPAEVIIGLDVGTTGVKAVAFGVTVPWRALALREYPMLTAGDREEQDPTAILRAVADALADCVTQVAGATVIAVSVSTAMHGLIGLDADLSPVTELITWADGRSREQSRRLRAGGVDLHALTGVPVHPMSPITKLAWFAENDPRALANARWWVGLKELVVAWLTGHIVSEVSSASGSGLLELGRRTWSEVAIELAGISAAQLPEVRATTDHLPLSPEGARRTGLRAGTPVVLGAGDGPLGNLGTGAITEGVAGMSLGTSGAVRVAVSTPTVDPEGTLFCYALTDSLWVLGSAISNGGAVLRWVSRLLDVRAEGDASADEVAIELAGRAPAGADGLVMLPYVLTERGPLWDPDLPGSFLGLGREHTRAHLIRAALEGVCIQMRLIVDRLAAFAPVTQIRATGGAFRTELCRTTMAAMVDLPFEVVGETDGTALGAAVLGIVGLGRAPTLADALTLLVGPDGNAPEPVAVDPRLARLYDEVRASIPDRLDELERVARWIEGSETRGVRGQ